MGVLVVVGAVLVMALFKGRASAPNFDPAGTGTSVRVSDCVKAGGKCYDTSSGEAVSVPCASCADDGAWS
jgi:hypothetical protein